MAIIDALGSGEELTATECAAVTGLSPSATAYHLTMLERYGFTERAPARADGRERPWRATDRRTAFDLDPTTPAGSAATAAVALAHFDTTRALGQQFIATEHEEPAAWRDAAALGNADVWLTVDETRELAAALTAVVERYRDRSLNDRPDGTRRVRVMNVVVPHRTNG
jgi:DNA-binding transcriptional ArsR family regulator